MPFSSVWLLPRSCHPGRDLIWRIELRTKLPMEAVTAVVFASGVAIAFLFLPVAQAEAALVGDISKVGVADTALSVVASLAIIITVKCTYKKLVLGNISEDLAASEGINVKRYNLIYLCMIAVIVALGVKMVGGLLTAALVAIPPAAARNLGKSLRQYTFGALAIGITSAVLGVVLFHATGLPAGPLIVLVSTAIFLVTLAFAR